MVKVSVLIPSYQHGRFLRETLASVLGQTERSLEVLLLDDGSTDDSFEIAEDMARRDSRLICTKQKNSGTIATLNRLFEQARGDYVCLLGSDDKWLPSFVAEAVEDLESHTEIQANFCGFSIIDSAGAELSPLAFACDKDLEGSDLMGHLAVQNCVGALTGCIRRSALEGVSVFARQLPGVEDWDLWLRLAQVGPLRLRKAMGAMHRVHGENQSFRNLKSSYRSQIKVLNDHASDLVAKYRLSASIRGEILGRKAWLLSQLGLTDEAVLCLEQKRTLVGLSADQCVAVAQWYIKIGKLKEADNIMRVLQLVKKRIGKVTSPRGLTQS